MKVYSDILTREDLYAALPADVYADVRTIPNARKRARGWKVSLEGLGARHTRYRNSGQYGAETQVMAATWDDHGVWMAALYEIDPLAQIACYRNRDDFYESTEREAAYRRGHRSRLIRENARAPWLDPAAIAGGAA